MAAVTAPAAKLIVVNVVLCVIATGLFVLRIISTKIRKREWQAHDILCFISYVRDDTAFVTKAC